MYGSLHWIHCIAGMLFRNDAPLPFLGTSPAKVWDDPPAEKTEEAEKEEKEEKKWGTDHLLGVFFQRV